MDARILLINLRSQNGLYAMDQGVPPEILRLLEAHAIRGRVFAPPQMTQIAELAEEIAEEPENTVVLFVEPDAQPLAQVLSVELLSAREEYTLYWCAARKLPCPEGVCSLDYAGLYALFSEDYTPPSSAGEPTESVESQEGYFHSMRNGYFAYISGIYPDSAVGFHVKHAGYSLPGDSPQTPKLAEYLNVNSAVFKKTDALRAEDYRTFTGGALREQKLIPHYHQVCAQPPYSLVAFDQLHCAAKTTPASYAEWCRLREQNAVIPDTMYLLDIVSQEDLSCFLEDVRRYEEEGRMPPPNFFLTDECRWSLKCQVKYLPRMQVTDKGEIQPCQNCPVCFGTLDDGYYSTVRSINRHLDREQLSRGCKSCKVKSICSKCALLPVFQGAPDYCAVRRQTPLLSDFLDKKNACQFLMQFTQTLKGAGAEDLRVSNPVYSTLFPNLPQAKTYDISKTAYLFFLQGTPLLFDLSNNTLLRIEEQLAFILEGYIKNYSKEEIAGYYAEAYGEGRELSCVSVAGGLDYLRNEGLVR